MLIATTMKRILVINWSSSNNKWVSMWILKNGIISRTDDQWLKISRYPNVTKFQSIVPWVSCLFRTREPPITGYSEFTQGNRKLLRPRRCSWVALKVEIELKICRVTRSIQFFKSHNSKSTLWKNILLSVLKRSWRQLQEYNMKNW